jgi:hypothetical protein
MSNKRSRVADNVFDTPTNKDTFNTDTMKVRGFGKLTYAQENICDLLEETKSYDIFTASSRLKARLISIPYPNPNPNPNYNR